MTGIAYSTCAKGAGAAYGNWMQTGRQRVNLIRGREQLPSGVDFFLPVGFSAAHSSPEFSQVPLPLCYYQAAAFRREEGADGAALRSQRPQCNGESSDDRRGKDYRFFAGGLFRATAALTSALNATASTFSPSWMSIALRVLPSRLELKRRDGSGMQAPWAKVSLTTFM